MALSKVGELGNFIRDQRRNARLSLRRLSNMAGISNPYLSQIERGMRRPSAEILQAIAKALRISAETLYVKAGILEERGEPTDTVTTILRDAHVSDKQKQALIEVYQSFRHENDVMAAPVAVPREATPKKTVIGSPKKAATKKAAAKREPATKKKAAAKKKPAARATAARRTGTRRAAARTGSRTTKTTRRARRTPAKRAPARTRAKR